MTFSFTKRKKKVIFLFALGEQNVGCEDSSMFNDEANYVNMNMNIILNVDSTDMS